MTEETLYQLSNCEIMRLDVDDEHYYYGATSDQKTKEYYLSLTRVLDIGAPFPEGLRQYLRITSFDEQMERLDFTGARGSKLHEALQALVGRQELNLSKDYPSTYEKGALVAFVQVMRFLQPSKIETELIVADPDLRIAGTLDLKCIVDEWRLTALLDPLKYLEIDSDGDLMLKEKWLDLPTSSKRVCIIWDHKFTGRNAYSHKVQVAAYKTMHNKSQRGTKASRAFTWRYSPKHKFGFDFNESMLNYLSFKRIYLTTIEYLQGFPEPPIIKRYPDKIRLFDKLKEENGSIK